ncbi:MAG TPA: HAD family acid phosphatase [Thermoanaerobaculia bacterium]
MRRSALVVLTLIVIACRSTTPAGPAAAPAAAPAPAGAGAQFNKAFLFSTLWIQTAAEYHAAALQTFGAATRALDAMLADASATAAVEQTGSFGALPPAVVVDIDETMLDNSPFQARLIIDGTLYSEELWSGWVEERKAQPVPGAVAFARAAADRGVVVFYVSNRNEAGETATRDNLRAAGFPLDERFDTVLLRGEREFLASDKSARRSAVASTHRVLLMIGDDLGDFLPNVRTSPAEREAMVERHAAWWGTRWFVVPNPMYGSWQLALTAGAAPAEIPGRFINSLRPER